ncbi:MAG TPA: heavy metal-associated domain-containing protein [Candidatus Eisenbacteria bacterium]|nr:heavy metal-associated domain-containing protein [Candidatus Eisenbacteria bacterium]
MKRDMLNAAALVAGLLVLAVGGPLLARELKNLPSRSLAARSGERIVTLDVAGMTCSGCASAVQTSLTGVSGVSTVAVRFPQRRAYVVCERDVADTALVAAVHRAGPGFSAAVTLR